MPSHVFGAGKKALTIGALGAISGLGIAGMSHATSIDVPLGNPTGDQPEAASTPLHSLSLADTHTVSVHAYKATDGLCFQLGDPEGRRDITRFCVNPDSAPYTTPGGIGSMTVSTPSHTVLVGLAPRTAARVTASTGKDLVATDVRDLDQALPGASRLKYFVAELPSGASVQSIEATDASGARVGSDAAGILP